MTDFLAMKVETIVPSSQKSVACEFYVTQVLNSMLDNLIYSQILLTQSKNLCKSKKINVSCLL